MVIMADKRGILTIIFAILVFFLICLVAAERAIVLDTYTALNNTLCRNIYSSQYVLILNNISNSSNLNQNLLLLESEYNKLLESVDDRDMFRYNLINYYNPSHENLRNAVKEWKKKNLNLTKQQRDNIKSNINIIKKEYDECYLKSIKNYSVSRLNSYKNILNYYGKQVESISESGVDVNELNNLLSDANKFVVNMENQLNQSNNSNMCISVVNMYCLNDGCVNGINYHFSEKYSYIKLKIAFNLIKKEESFSEGNISQLSIYIEQIGKGINDVNNNKFSAAEKKSIWENIKASNNLIKEIKIIIRNQK
jgi:hypothetical protein